MVRHNNLYLLFSTGQAAKDPKFSETLVEILTVSGKEIITLSVCFCQLLHGHSTSERKTKDWLTSQTDSNSAESLFFQNSHDYSIELAMFSNNLSQILAMCYTALHTINI